ncbi:MAG: hypothetical protein LBJ23_11130 [Tannerella sp.]|jgi:hypothetical protein|nr:hypothetical protein [Tannerella sp.]
MKRMMTVFLLIVTLFASGHATLAFHYCGGNLRDVGLAGYAEAHVCCCTATHREAGGNRTGVTHTPCCADHFVSLVTDDYPAARQAVIIEAHAGWQPAPFVEDDFSCAGVHAPLLRQIFPPDDPAPHCAALRHLICTYRL